MCSLKLEQCCCNCALIQIVLLQKSRLKSARQAVYALMRTASKKSTETATPAKPGPFKRISVQPGESSALTQVGIVSWNRVSEKPDAAHLTS